MARKPIIQRIALEGGKAMEDQLKALGDAGEKAFEQIRSAAIRADLTKFGTSLKTFGSDLATVGRRVALAFAGLTTVATGAGAAVLGLAKSGAEAADQAGKAAEKTGLQIDAYGRLAFAAEQADVSSEQFVAGMSRLNKAIAEAAKGGAKGFAQLGEAGSEAGEKIVDQFGRSVETFDELGVSVTRFGEAIKGEVKKGGDGAAQVFAALGVRLKDANGRLRSTEDIIGDVAEAFARMPDGPLKAARAIELFGRSGAELLPFLNQGRKGLAELGETAESLGLVFTKEQATLGDQLGDVLDEIGKTIAGVRNQLGLLFAPIVLAGAETFRDFIARNRLAIIELGRTAAQVTASFLGDLVAALTGNDREVTRPWILEWRDAFVTFGRDVQAVFEGVILPLFRAIREGAQLVADGINAVFGTRITGGQLLITAVLLQLLGVFKLFTSGVGVVIAGLRLLGTILAPLFGAGLIAAAGNFFRILITGATAFLGLVAGLVGWPALIVAGVVAAGAAIVIFWDDIKAAAIEAYDFIVALFTPESLAAVFEALRQAGALAGQAFVEALALAFQAIGTIFTGAGELVLGFVEGVIAAVANLATSLLPSWGAITAAGSAVWTTIADAAALVWSGIVIGAQGLLTLLAPVWTAISTAGAAVWGTISAAATTAFNAISVVATTAINAVIDTVGSLVSGVVEAFTGATSEVAAAADAIGAAIARATEAAGDIEGAGELAAKLVAPFEQAAAQIDRIMAEIRNFVVRGFNAIKSEVASIANSIDAMIARIVSALRRAAAEAAKLRAQASSSGSGSSAPRLAGGGQVRGAGGPRSDSILSWLSNGEFVINAAATRAWLPILHAINSFRLSPSDLLKGFSLGGLVDGINASFAGMGRGGIPAFAGGGMAELAPAGAGGPALNLHLPGGDVVRTVLVDMGADEVAAKFAGFMGGAALNSTGRSQSWKGRR